MANNVKEFQKSYFKKPFVANFKWRTENPYVSVKESLILASLADDIKLLPDNALILESGCGEGPNIALLRNLGVKQKICGVDFSHERVVFCQQNLKDVTGITASAASLPFKDRTFDFVFFRDLLHHTGNLQKKVLDESFRVLKDAGVLYFMEANGRNLGFFLQALAIRAERGLLASNIKNIANLAATLGHFELFMYEPSNFYRVIFHYSVGFPNLAYNRFFIFLSNAIIKISKKFVPQSNWAYICVKIIK